MKRIFGFLISLAMSGAFLAAPAMAHGPAHHVQEEASELLSYGDAKRIARRFLREQGYSLRIGPGGARVHSLQRNGLLWRVQVRVSRGGGIHSARHTLFIHARNGVVSAPRVLGYERGVMSNDRAKLRSR